MKLATICKECGHMHDAEVSEVSFWYMHDNHCFTRLTGRTVEEIAAKATEARNASRCGMLCTPRIVGANGREIGRVNAASVGCHGSSEKADAEWATGVTEWIAAVKDHPGLSEWLTSPRNLTQ